MVNYMTYKDRIAAGMTLLLEMLDSANPDSVLKKTFAVAAKRINVDDHDVGAIVNGLSEAGIVSGHEVITLTKHGNVLLDELSAGRKAETELGLVQNKIADGKPK